MRPLISAATLVALTCVQFSGLAGSALAETDPALAAAIAGPQRTPAMAARDPIRHPAEELSFFGLKPTMTVVEIWPEGGYWTEILGPYLHDKGVYYTAVASTTGKMADRFQAKLDGDKADYGNVKVVVFGKDHYDMVPPGTADLVVTFRNVHNWMDGGWAEPAFAAFYKALKPGGVLGVEEHRGRTDQPQDPAAKSGYVRQDYAIELARKAGFELVGSSEIDANPKDTKDYPEGVWTLPPTFQLGDKDRAKYAAIGEADNFVLKFRKPVK
jgi:predicted methyltransferase